MNKREPLPPAVGIDRVGLLSISVVLLTTAPADIVMGLLLTVSVTVAMSIYRITSPVSGGTELELGDSSNSYMLIILVI
jgi:hypothetical protein